MNKMGLKVVTQVYTWCITEPRLKPMSHEDLWWMDKEWWSKSDFKVKKIWNFLSASGYATWRCVWTFTVTESLPTSIPVH